MRSRGDGTAAETAPTAAPTVVRLSQGLPFITAAIAVAVCILCLVLVFVIPWYARMFEEMGSYTMERLPFQTQVLLSVSRFVASGGFLLAPAIPAGFWYFFHKRPERLPLPRWLWLAVAAVLVLVLMANALFLPSEFEPRWA